jgi:multisubunit Na+/H+ antiporter MnhE subunit
MPGARAAIAWLVTWVLCMVLWLWLTTTTNGSELIAGVGASAIAATAFEVVREREAPAFRPRLRWLRRLPLLPVLVVKDTVVVFRELTRQLGGGRRRPGRLRTIPLPDAADEAEANAFDLCATIGVSLAPNSYVIGFDRERKEILVHQYRPEAPASLRDLLRP